MGEKEISLSGIEVKRSGGDAKDDSGRRSQVRT